MVIEKIIEKAVESFNRAFENVRAETEEEKRVVLAKYYAAIQPNFVQWLATSISAVRASESKEMLRKNLREEITQDHPGMLKRFCDSAGVVIRPEDFEKSTQDLYYISGDVFDRGYATSVRKVAALAVMENSSQLFIPILRDYASSLGARDLEYADVHGIADKEHADELLKALSLEVETQISFGHNIGFCESAAKIGANVSAEFLVNILNPDREKYISI